MKINLVKQFVASNVSKIEKQSDKPARFFNLYDKNNIFRGEYNYIPLHKSDFYGVRSSLSSTRIMDKNRKVQMQEHVFINKDYVTLKDKSSDTLTKALPKTITITRTIIDFVKDKFITVRTTSKLKNNLQRIAKDDPDFTSSKNFVLYEPLNKKPQYEKVSEIVREGSVSDVKKQHRLNNKAGVPFMYW